MQHRLIAIPVGLSALGQITSLCECRRDWRWSIKCTNTSQLPNLPSETTERLQRTPLEMRAVPKLGASPHKWWPQIVRCAPIAVRSDISKTRAQTKHRAETCWAVYAPKSVSADWQPAIEYMCICSTDICTCLIVVDTHIANGSHAKRCASTAAQIRVQLTVDDVSQAAAHAASMTTLLHSQHADNVMQNLRGQFQQVCVLVFRYLRTGSIVAVAFEMLALICTPRHIHLRWQNQNQTISNTKFCKLQFGEHSFVVWISMNYDFVCSVRVWLIAPIWYNKPSLFKFNHNAWVPSDRDLRCVETKIQIPPPKKKHTIIIVHHFNTLPVRVSSRNLIYDA